jgi:hypothetical protein
MRVVQCHASRECSGTFSYCYQCAFFDATAGTGKEGVFTCKVAGVYAVEGMVLVFRLTVALEDDIGFTDC